MSSSIDNLRFNNWQIYLSSWSVIEVQGNDGVSFLQGQTTNDLNSLKLNHAFLNARLNQNGKIQAYFYTAKKGEKLFLFVPSDLAESLIEDLNKFIIMEDVILNQSGEKLFFTANYNFSNKITETFVEAEYAGVKGIFTFLQNETELIPEKEIFDLTVLNGFPIWGENVTSKMFINETFLNESAISYKKGCFLGQETVAKIHNNRGAANYPVIIEIDEKCSMNYSKVFINDLKIGEIQKITILDNKTLLHTIMIREFRVENKKIYFDVDGIAYSGLVKYYPYFKNKSPQELAIELYEESLKVFNQGKTEFALELVEKSLALFEMSDSLEVKGVMLGRMEKFEEAILVMNRLSEIDPFSIMAHTNKSLYLMRLGKISEAEEEKSIATVKSFERFGEEAKLKKMVTQEKEKKAQELLSREKMFKQVLEIDEEDAIANFGMGDISFSRSEFSLAIVYLKKALIANSNYSTAYLLLGKCYEAIGEKANAIEIYEVGIKVASKKGDMMPANEMQALLNNL